MLSGRAGDIKKHKWFEGLDWDALEARKLNPPRKPKEDSAKRLKELTVAYLLLHIFTPASAQALDLTTARYIVENRRLACLC